MCEYNQKAESQLFQTKHDQLQDLPGGPVVQNLPSNVGDKGLIPGQGTKIPHDAGKPRSSCTTREACMSCATMKTQHNWKKEKRKEKWSTDGELVF